MQLLCLQVPCSSTACALVPHAALTPGSATAQGPQLAFFCLAWESLKFSVTLTSSRTFSIIFSLLLPLSLSLWF